MRWGSAVRSLIRWLVLRGLRWLSSWLNKCLYSVGICGLFYWMICITGIGDGGFPGLWSVVITGVGRGIWEVLFLCQNYQLFVGLLKSLTLDQQKDCPVKSRSLMHAVHSFSESDFFPWSRNKNNSTTFLKM